MHYQWYNWKNFIFTNILILRKMHVYEFRIVMILKEKSLSYCKLRDFAERAGLALLIPFERTLQQ